MKFGISKIDILLRLSAILFLVLTACLVGLDTQTRRILYIEKKAQFQELNSLVILVYVDSVAAGYNLLRLFKCSTSVWFGGNLKWSCIYMAWVCFLLDQMAAYIVFTANLAAFEESLLAVTGANAFQWMKLCNRYTRFCIQIGGALVCGYVAAFLSMLISFISAFKLFRHYSPKRFLLLKAT